MKKRKYLISILLVISTIISCKKEEKKTKEALPEQISTRRIISLGGAATEIISALGHESEIVGKDVTSTFPESVKNRAKNLGHVSSISMESIMTLHPTIIIGTHKDINPGLLEKIKKSGINTHILTQEYSPEGTKKLIQEIAFILNEKNYKKLETNIDKQLTLIKPIEKTPKVLFIYARGTGTLMVSGKNTPIDTMITLAGGQNVITAFENFKPLTPESLIKDNPDVILLFNSGLESLNGIDGLLKIQGIEKTNAGKNKRIITMDGELLAGFGPRIGEGVLLLNNLLLNDAK